MTAGILELPYMLAMFESEEAASGVELGDLDLWQMLDEYDEIIRWN
jgi:hypothetical protein